MLVSDEGFPGLVIHLDLLGSRFESDDGVTIVEAAAGEDWDRLVQECVERGLAGFECLSGIPGRVGATPIQNVGAYGQEVSETIVDLEAWDRRDAAVVRFTNDQCDFAYRDSRFKGRERDRYIILSVRYRLTNDGGPTIRYPDLMRHLEEEGITSPTLSDVRDTVLSIRAAKGMVLAEDDPDSRSAGSFFTNPIIAEEGLPEFLRLVKQADVLEEGEPVPRYPAGDGMVKLSAAWIIQHAGFHRGHQHGNIGISNKHTLALVNRGGGTAAEVLELVEQIQNRAKRLFGIELVPEPNLIGF
jgi:UDP-N-acetylmuramate dehydrogenase